MSDLISSGLELNGSTIAPECVDWSAVKRLAILDMMDTDNRPVLFAPIVVWADDTWARLTETLDIETARKTCASLSAIHDKPVQDWTRLAPPGLARQFLMWSAAQGGHVHPSRMDEVPDQEPVWGVGWNETDWLFRDGATDEEFEDSISEWTASIRQSDAFNGAGLMTVESALAIQTDEARKRWIMLHAANNKPEPPNVEVRA